MKLRVGTDTCDTNGGRYVRIILVIFTAQISTALSTCFLRSQSMVVVTITTNIERCQINKIISQNFHFSTFIILYHKLSHGVIDIINYCFCILQYVIDLKLCYHKKFSVINIWHLCNNCQFSTYFLCCLFYMLLIPFFVAIHTRKHNKYGQYYWK